MWHGTATWPGQVRDQHAPHAAIWLTETASFSGGGIQVGAVANQHAAVLFVRTCGIWPAALGPRAWCGVI